MEIYTLNTWTKK